ncbi:MAG TPA: hypothetical protein VNU25_01195 [Candidatus Paceibacterota bacterium]|nr:hypothetical protein [Candidatus Paceibacterota bacterium]
MEGLNRDAFPVNAKLPEQSTLPDNEQALQAFRLLEGAAAREVLHTFWSPTISQDEFLAGIEAFNALPPEERGKGRIETKTLENRYERSGDLTHPKGYPYTVTQGVDGTLSLSSPLADLA